MLKPALTKAAIQFIVHDVVKTAEYYRDVLGFSILGYFLDPPVYAMVTRDNVEIHFGRADGDEIKTNDAFRSIAVDGYVWTDDIEGLFEELRSRNADIVEEL